MFSEDLQSSGDHKSCEAAPLATGVQGAKQGSNKKNILGPLRLRSLYKKMWLWYNRLLSVLRLCLHMHALHLVLPCQIMSVSFCLSHAAHLSFSLSFPQYKQQYNSRQPPRSLISCHLNRLHSPCLPSYCPHLLGSRSELTGLPSRVPCVNGGRLAAAEKINKS